MVHNTSLTYRLPIAVNFSSEAAPLNTPTYRLFDINKIFLGSSSLLLLLFLLLISWWAVEQSRIGLKAATHRRTLINSEPLRDDKLEESEIGGDSWKINIFKRKGLKSLERLLIFSLLAIGSVSSLLSALRTVPDSNAKEEENCNFQV